MSTYDELLKKARAKAEAFALTARESLGCTMRFVWRTQIYRLHLPAIEYEKTA